ncbi:uncharacterized protein J4E84_001605 [Alternaria hordeiaustralica]|uniref:uncharacterized protein n=1 Tax=Alternaria hordeiaustralica TaxID=1187925 RepID=UPI0020C33B4C|nr:uncharacterized protein J4E84_001605 [Alternaria hordeiaustralica]KAI4694981.1 hypothetical protein J4E84_001605 [Alternaria hordeiaustralica]
MDHHQQYGTRVKSEDVELEHWVPTKQEHEVAERVPAVVAKVEPSGECCQTVATFDRPEIAHNKAREFPPSTGKRKRGSRSKKPPKRVRDAEKLRKSGEMPHIYTKNEGADQNLQAEKFEKNDVVPRHKLDEALAANALLSKSNENKRSRMNTLNDRNQRLRQERDKAVIQRAEMLSQQHARLSTESISNIEIQNSRLRQELVDAHKTIADTRASLQAIAQKEQLSPPHQEPESVVFTKGVSTTRALRLEISELERRLKEALVEGENAKRDARAFKKNNVDAEALEKQLAVERAKNRALVGKLQKALKSEHNEDNDEQSGSRSFDEKNVGMKGLLEYCGGQTEQHIKVEDEDMDSE